MPYVNVPNDLSKIKTKIAFNLTKRQLICFGLGAAIGVPTYLLTRQAIGNTGALFAMLAIMLPAFLLAMYEKDGLPFEKVIRNIIRVKFTRPGIRPYRTENIYAQFVRKEEPIEQNKKSRETQVNTGRCPPSRPFLISPCTRTGSAKSPAGFTQRRWNMRTSIMPWRPRRIRLPLSAGGAAV